MATSAEVQQKFIELIKEKLPHQVSLADELAELLNISNDSAYRRMRGDTLFALDEILILSKKFHISLDGLGASNDFVTFQYIPIDYKNYTVSKLFEVILKDLEEASKVDKAELYYLARDIPIFHLLHFKEICAFKIYFWEKFHGDPDLKTEKFHPEVIDPQLTDLGRKIWQEYVKFPSTEIWGLPTYSALIDEIDFVWESSQMESKEVALELCNKAIDFINHIKKQAELGCKFNHDTSPIERPHNFNLYITEVQLTHNKVLTRGDLQRAYIPTSLDTLITTNEHYCERNYQLFQNSLKQSTLVSVTGEKARNRYVEKCVQKVTRLLSRIENS